VATKAVKFCDVCDKPETEIGKVLPGEYAGESREYCFTCASGELRRMYGAAAVLPTEQVTPAQAEADRMVKRMEELTAQHGTKIHPVRPNEEVEPGKVISYGQPIRSLEIIEQVAGNPALWFAKII
jgi:hypothetical protein